MPVSETILILQPFWYCTGLWQTQMDRQTGDRHRTV